MARQRIPITKAWPKLFMGRFPVNTTNQKKHSILTSISAQLADAWDCKEAKVNMARSIHPTPTPAVVPPAPWEWKFRFDAKVHYTMELKTWQMQSCKTWRFLFCREKA